MRQRNNQESAAQEILDMLVRRMAALRAYETEFKSADKHGDDYQTTLILINEISALIAKAKAIMSGR